MVRIEDSVARVLLMLLDGDHEETSIFDGALKSEGGPSSRKLIQSLNEQLSVEFSNEGMLIDQVIRILNSQWSRNIISGQALESLRQAILLPSERATLAENLAHMACSSCGVRLYDREMTTLRLTGSRPDLFCTKCAIPVKAKTCSIAGCTQTVEVPKSVGSWLSKRIECGNHTGDVQQAPPDGLWGDSVMDRLRHDQGRQGSRIITGGGEGVPTNNPIRENLWGDSLPAQPVQIWQDDSEFTPEEEL